MNLLRYDVILFLRGFARSARDGDDDDDIDFTLKTFIFNTTRVSPKVKGENYSIPLLINVYRLVWYYIRNEPHPYLIRYSLAFR